MSPQVLLALIIGIAAIADDLLYRKISNWIPAVALAGGVAALSLERGWKGAGSSLLGASGGFLVFLIFYLLGGMGGGDVKLMAGFGAVLGWEHLLALTLWTAAWGGLIALGTIAARSIRSWFRRSPESRQKVVTSIPYAPAIALGAWLSLVATV
jgi:prepilin peptidase CpaA